ncbi:MAG: ClpP family protease [Cellulosilyticaceae bacterium]
MNLSKNDTKDEPVETKPKQENEAPKQEESTESIKEFGQLPMNEDSGESPIHCISIIGQIEGHVSMPPQNKTTKYEHLIPQMLDITQNSKIKGVLVVLNTVGGDVEAGLALAELIASINKPVVSLVLGGAHSIGVPIAVSSDYSFITPSATMTLHPVRMSGTVIGVAQTFEFFEEMQERIVEFVSNHSHITADRFRALMLDTGKLAKDMGTILNGKEAVEEKLIDELGGLSNAVDKLYELIEEGQKENGTL